MDGIDLTDLTRGYRYRQPTAGTLERARHAAVGRTGVLLDVGGGNGTHAQQWVGDSTRPIVVDPSQSMCVEAAARPGVDVVRSVSQRLPFRSAAADLVYFHLSIHYGPWTDALDEAMRVAGPGAVIEIWTFTPESMPRSALAQWFPRIGQIDALRFPPVGGLASHLRHGGFTVEVEQRPETVERTAASWEQAVRNRFVSTIQLLTEDEVDEGLDRFRTAHPDGDEPYRYTIEFVRIKAWR